MIYMNHILHGYLNGGDLSQQHLLRNNLRGLSTSHLSSWGPPLAKSTKKWFARTANHILLAYHSRTTSVTYLLRNDLHKSYTSCLSVSFVSSLVILFWLSKSPNCGVGSFLDCETASSYYARCLFIYKHLRMSCWRISDLFCYLF